MAWSRATLCLIKLPPATSRHQTPTSDAARCVANIVKVWPTKDQVPDLMGAHPNPGIFWNGQELEYLGLFLSNLTRLVII
jgi:hypothetical protein